MKKYLLPKGGNFYKANLHCHSNISDGQLSPEELKETYKAMGYSVLAYTDHDVMISHQDLADESFLPLNGYEMEVTQVKTDEIPWPKTCHMCLIALEPDNLKQVCWHREKYMVGNGAKFRSQVQFDEKNEDYIREYTPECINDMMKKGRDHGFFVTYNHPTWSCENYEQYTKYNHMNAMEICNYSCITLGHEEYNARVYDDMLRVGKRIYCVGTDDNHNRIDTKGTAKWDSGGAWTMIKADKLEYRTITKALEEGNFYASCGPEIHELWVEDGKLYIRTSDVEKIMFKYGNRKAKYFCAEKGESINEASVDLSKEDGYIRVTVVDHFGKCANTNAYFTT